MVLSPPVRCHCGGLIRSNVCTECGPKKTRSKVKREHHKLYDTQRWRRASKLFRAYNALCVMCEQAGRIKPASLVDHVMPHKGDVELFWDETNWQSLCWKCHGVKSQAE